MLPQTALVVLLLPVEVISELGMSRKVVYLLLDLALLSEGKGLDWAGMGSFEDAVNALDRRLKSLVMCLLA